MVNYREFGPGVALEKQRRPSCCLLSVAFAFTVGLSVGIVIPLVYSRHSKVHVDNRQDLVNRTAIIRTIFVNHSYSSQNSDTDRKFKRVAFLEDVPKTNEEGVIEKGIYWGGKIEEALPAGYDRHQHEVWSKYVSSAVAVKLEPGCGRMQNRLVTFQDGIQGCVRYRQNTDQIQGELFSFYLAQILKLPNLAPSAVSVVNLSASLWQNLAHDIASAQWNSNRPIVLTQYIPNLDAASIPSVFKPVERHLNRNDVLNMTARSVNEVLEGSWIRNLVELAQWSDLIVFDYLTANLDRIVNNLYNYQWNVNIMDAPAHNLAKKVDNDLLVFLDNESGLLHGYRLLKKYEIYHSILLENLCVFRRSTADIIKSLKRKSNVGALLRNMFESRNDSGIKDVLPTLPDKSVKILNERIETVYNQIVKCEAMFAESNT